MLNDPNSRGLWCLKLRQFLQVDGIHTLPSTSIPEASAPMEPEGDWGIEIQMGDMEFLRSIFIF